MSLRSSFLLLLLAASSSHAERGAQEYQQEVRRKIELLEDEEWGTREASSRWLKQELRKNHGEVLRELETARKQETLLPESRRRLDVILETRRRTVSEAVTREVDVPVTVIETVTPLGGGAGRPRRPPAP